MPSLPSFSPPHPALWRGNQFLQSPGRCVDTGYPTLSPHLPGGGWPLGSLIDLLPARAGIGELQLLRPALLAQSTRPIALIGPAHVPQVAAWSAWGGHPSSLLWLQPRCHADALWAAEQILRSGTFGAVLLWQNAVRAPLLRRLHLSAQCGDTLFVVFRPISAAVQACPAPLRVCLHPAPRGLDVVILKRRGHPANDPIFLPIYSDTRFPEPHHVPVVRHPSHTAQPGRPVSGLAN